jgi:hypothetical protein
MRCYWPLAAFALAALLVLPGCGSGNDAPSYEQQITQERVARDMEMRDKNSVIPVGRRDAFRGLNYFDVDSTYRYMARLERLPQPDTVRMPQSTGAIAEQIVVGEVRLPVAGGTTLTVFRVRSGPDSGQLWIPFADATNGQTTYKAGRYVDLEDAPGDSVVVDFNRAYNPTCTYNPEYACPLPPPQNHIPAPIPAGEKTPSFAS